MGFDSGEITKSMASSVEVRVPLLQKDTVIKYFHNIIEANQIEQKSRLKSYLKSKMGSDYFSVKKQGFRYPINNYIMNEINWKKVINYMSENEIINTNLINEYVNHINYGIDKVSMKLWYVYTLYKWHKTFNVKS